MVLWTFTKLLGTFINLVKHLSECHWNLIPLITENQQQKKNFFDKIDLSIGFCTKKRNSKVAKEIKQKLFFIFSLGNPLFLQGPLPLVLGSLLHSCLLLFLQLNSLFLLRTSSCSKVTAGGTIYSFSLPDA